MRDAPLWWLLLACSAVMITAGALLDFAPGPRAKRYGRVLFAVGCAVFAGCVAWVLLLRES